VVKKIHETNQSRIWMERPLATTLLSYAAKDIHLIRLIYARFERRGYLSAKDELLAQSQRYVSMHDNVKPLQQDRYRSSPVLPLDVLEAPVGTSRRECDACHRSLSMKCFMEKGGKHAVVCRVCHVVALKYRTPLSQNYR
jgi:exonuclease 3'-5' domain-containing protein 1